MLLISAHAHLFNGYQLLHSILEYRLIPTSLAVIVAALLPYLQLTLGVALLFLPSFRLYALALCVPVFAIFVFVQLSAHYRGLDISCGCFGSDSTKIGWKSVGIAGAGFVLCLIGFVGPSRSARPAKAVANRAAFTLIELLVVIAILAILVGLLLAAVQKVRASAANADCQNRMKQIALATHQYHGSNGAFPPGLSIRNDNGKKPYLGWTARMLPYLEQNPLWDEIQIAFATDPSPLVFYGHAPHAKILATPVKSFACPADARVPGPGQIGFITIAYTSYLGVEGTNQYLHDGVLYLDSNVRFADIRDGTSNTLCIGERPPPADLRVGWWYRGWGQAKEGSTEMLLGVRERNETRPECDPTGHSFSPGRFDGICDQFHFWSPHPGGANFAFADGSVRFLRYSANDIMPALATRAGGEAVTAE